MIIARRALAAVLFLCIASPASLRAEEPAPAAAPEPSETLSASQLRSDLDALYEAMQAASVDLYAYRSKEDFDAFYAGLRAGVTGPMSRLEAALLFQRLAAFARIGHIRSNAWLGEVFAEFGKGARFAPIFIRVERDGRVVLTDHANADASGPAGARLVAIDGEPIARILARTRNLISAERDYMADTLLEDFFPPLFWAQNRDARAFDLDLVVNGDTRTVSVPAVTFGEFRAMGSAVPSPATDFNARDYHMIGDTIAYLRPGPFGALEGEEPVDGHPEAAMVRFLDESFTAMIAAGARDLILDLRNNPGGDIAFSDPMIAWFAERPFRFASRFTLRASAPAKAHYDRVAPEDPAENPAPDAAISPFLARLAAAERAQANGTLYPFEIPMVSPREGERFTGRVWVLINRKSYSNATSTAALIQDYGFGRILGEETADVPTSFASIFPYTLPGSAMSVDLAKSHFIRPGGDQRVRGVIPDTQLARQVVGSPQDTMLESALEVIRAAQ